MTSDPGNDESMPDGSFTITLNSESETIELSGTFVSSSVASLAAPFEDFIIDKIADRSLAEGVRSGALVAPSTGTTPLSLVVCSQGSVSDFNDTQLAGGQGNGFFVNEGKAISFIRQTG
jgi:hypothetical protein